MERYLTFDLQPGVCADPEHLLNPPGHACHQQPYGGDYPTVRSADESVGSDMYHLYDSQTQRWYQPGAWPAN